MSTPPEHDQDNDNGDQKPAKKPNEEVLRREARLKQALRDNLMRRKGKARAVKSTPPPSNDD
ncbi:hypothetical protein [Ahrensia sp. R2A130]|uniref:hypothetical protein n=1 Tax=Ahrensia sp. R2A130 TaxID=744979 RepID=UPI0001E0E89B|nr:hypothetical protein [Ahrensia sp. R2A130]EFL89353.1 conserved hypothetical protein [Ahrensia sp. R2A130]